MRDHAADIVLTDDELRSLGKIVALATVLEREVAFGIWVILGVAGAGGFAVTAELNASSRLNMLRVLAHTYVADKTEYVSLLSAIALATSANDKRNQAVHGTWTPMFANDAFAVRVKARKGEIESTTSSVALKASQLGTMVKELEDAIQAMRAFFLRKAVIERVFLKDNGYVLRDIPTRTSSA